MKLIDKLLLLLFSHFYSSLYLVPALKREIIDEENEEILSDAADETSSELSFNSGMFYYTNISVMFTIYTCCWFVYKCYGFKI